LPILYRILLGFGAYLSAPRHYSGALLFAESHCSTKCFSRFPIFIVDSRNP